jgi:RNA polymerase sigma-70 factor, ECF subfamily
MDIHEMIRAAQNGHEAAIVSIYQMYAQATYQYVAYRVPIEDAEDLTAEVFISAMQDLPRYRISETPFEDWLLGIALAHITDYHQRHPRYPVADLIDLTPEVPMLLNQDNAELRDGLKKLSHEQQDVLVLRFVNRKNHEEVARILNKSVSAIKMIQHRALTQLAAARGSKSTQTALFARWS